MKRRGFVWVGLGLALLACDPAGPTTTPPRESAPPPKTIYIVRHAEKLVNEGERDPELSEAGLARARALPEALEGVQIDEIYTSDFQRTRQTVAPVAETAGLEPLLYDPADAEGTAARLSGSSAANILVAGHSNTIPDLIDALGGPPPRIADDQYGDLFVLTLDGKGTSLELRHYGR